MFQDIVVYDIEIAKEVNETKGGWKNPHGMGFGCAVAYSYINDEYLFFLGEESRKKLINFLNGKFIVTFNGVRFDSKNLLGNDRQIEIRNETTIIVKKNNFQWVEYDIFLNSLRSLFKYKNVLNAVDTISPGGLSLDAICKQTLKLAKNGNGAKAPILFKKKIFDQLFQYNLNDVRLTKKLFDHIVRNGNIISKKILKMDIDNTIRNNFFYQE